MEPLVGGAGGEEEGGEDSLAREPVDRAEGRFEDSLLKQKFIIYVHFFEYMALFGACSVPG